MMIQPKIFKGAMSQLACGVTVVTTQAQGITHGMTASSFSSVSLEPPTVLVCIAKHLRSHMLISQSRVFAVNILNADQVDWGMRFAGMQPEIEDRFTGINFSTAVTGSPILPDTLSWVDCELRYVYDADDHSIFVGQVVAGDTGNGNGDNPLLYYNRAWRNLAQVEPVTMA